MILTCIEFKFTMIMTHNDPCRNAMEYMYLWANHCENDTHFGLTSKETSCWGRHTFHPGHCVMVDVDPAFWLHPPCGASAVTKEADHQFFGDIGVLPNQHGVLL